MADNIAGPRFDFADRAVALALVLIGIAACDKETTSPVRVASAVAITSGAAQTGTVGSTLAVPVVVRITDAAGSPVAGIAVAFTPAASDGSVSAALVTTDSTGSASVAWTLGTVAGMDSMTVAAGALAPVSVVATGTADAPAAITIVAGNDQTAPVDSTLGAVLTVKVIDKYGNAVPNATVQWTSDAGGTLGATTTTTDANGIAQDSYTLGPTAGTEDVIVTLMNASTPVSASFTEMGN